MKPDSFVNASDFRGIRRLSSREYMCHHEYNVNKSTRRGWTVTVTVQMCLAKANLKKACHQLAPSSNLWQLEYYSTSSWPWIRRAVDFIVSHHARIVYSIKDRSPLGLLALTNRRQPEADEITVLTVKVPSRVSAHILLIS